MDCELRNAYFLQNGGHPRVSILNPCAANGLMTEVWSPARARSREGLARGRQEDLETMIQVLRSYPKQVRAMGRPDEGKDCGNFCIRY